MGDVAYQLDQDAEGARTTVELKLPVVLASRWRRPHWSPIPLTTSRSKPVRIQPELRDCLVRQPPARLARADLGGAG
jgi:hypothetical protein